METARVAFPLFQLGRPRRHAGAGSAKAADVYRRASWSAGNRPSGGGSNLREASFGGQHPDVLFFSFRVTWFCVAYLRHRMHRAEIWPRGPMDPGIAAGSSPAGVICPQLRLAVFLPCPFRLALEAGLRLKSAGEEESNPCMSPCPVS